MIDCLTWSKQVVPGGAVSDICVRLRRRRYFLVRVVDEQDLDIGRFLRGEMRLRHVPQCALLCPVRGNSLPLTAAELALSMTIPADRWLASSELQALDADTRSRLLELARRGVLLADPAFAQCEDLASGEELLEQTRWHDVAAVFQAQSRWQGVETAAAGEIRGDLARARFENLRRENGEPPPHFVRCNDAGARVALNVPTLDGTFFDTLLARRTTRSFVREQALPKAALEVTLYAVFGAHGIRALGPGLSAIKRTSPSAGALHPIEAYVLALNVEGIPCGIYHYEIATHALAAIEAMTPADARELARRFTAGQAYFADAHALIVHVARFDRTFWKYARHRKAYKAVLMDSAHLSQTLYLTAAHLGLGAYFTTAINDVDIASRLHLAQAREAAIGINGVGIADTADDELAFVADPYRPTDAFN